MEQEYRVNPEEAKALFAYLTVLGSALGRLRTEGGAHRRATQLLEPCLEECLEEWIRQHPNEPAAVHQKLRKAHQAVLDTANKARDRFEKRD